MIQPMRNQLALRLIVIVAVCAVFTWFDHSALAYEFTQDPRQIIIPKIALSLPVTTTKLSYNTWEVSPTLASFGEYTALPGTAGNTVIFAHARAGLFQDLPELTAGDLIQVFTAYDWFSYVVDDVLTVSPENVDVILSSKKYELTLFTCTGVNDSHRLVVQASLVPAIKI